MIDRKGDIDLKYLIVLALTMAFVSKLRQDGIYIAIPTLLVLLAYMFKRKPSSKDLYFFLPVLTIAFILIIACLNVAYNVEDAQTNQNLHFNLNDAPIVWDITRDKDWTGEAYYINAKGSNIEHAKDKYFTSINSTPKESYEDLKDVNHGSDKYKSLNSIVNAARANHALDTLFNSPALYMYLAIILLIVMHVMFKTKEMYLVYLPNLLNIIIVFLTIPAQENRYLYSNQLVFYLLVVILISLIMYSKRESLPTLPKAPEVSEKLIDEDDDGFGIDNNLNEIPEIEDIYQAEDIYMDKLPAEEMQPQDEEISKEITDDLIDEILKEMEMEKQNKE